MLGKDDGDWVKRSMLFEVDGVRKTEDDLESGGGQGYERVWTI